MSSPVLVTVIVPVLEERAVIERVLDHIAALPGRFEVVVVDGGSRDGTAERARAHRCTPRVICAPRGRGSQMNAGARVARGEILVFLHADTRLPMSAHRSLSRAVRAGAEGGNFRLRFDGGGLFASVLGGVYRLQRVIRVFYGDSAIWATRRGFARLGGYPEIPIMEDVAFARELIAGGRCVTLPGPAVTSSRRWREVGAMRTMANWLLIRGLHNLGVAPERLARLYRVAR